MKKFVAIVLSLVLVFAVAIIASAAPTVSGELDFGKNFEANSNIANGKVGFNSNIAEGMNTNIVLKADPIDTTGVTVDEAWFQAAKEFGTFKVGYFGYNQKGGIDILTPAIGDIKDGLTASYSVKLNDNVTLNAAAANDDETVVTPEKGLVYSAGIGYATENFGGDVNYFKPVVGDDNTAIGMNAWYKMDDLKIYGNYENNSQSTVKDMIVGANYDSAKVPVYARGEYNLQQNISGTNAYGVRVGYKVNNNMKLQYDLMRNDTAADAQTLKAIVTF